MGLSHWNFGKVLASPETSRMRQQCGLDNLTMFIRFDTLPECRFAVEDRHLMKCSKTHKKHEASRLLKIFPDKERVLAD